jgi:hypothetical protein
VPAASIAQALPYVNWILLVALAVGSFGFVAILGQVTDATRGYLGFTAVCAAILAAIALVADLALPATSGLTIRAAPAELDLARRAGLVAFIVLALGYVVALRRERRPLPLAVGTGIAAAATLVAAAAGWAPTLVDSVPLIVQLVVLAAAAGGALASVILGHWYLVTPRISERPLVLAARLLTGVVALQLALFVVWTTLGGGPGQLAFDAFAGGPVLFVILRLVVSLLFAVVLSYMAIRTAETRSMESATGLLYIDLAAILAGTIGAAALYLSAGLLV